MTGSIVRAAIYVALPMLAVFSDGIFRSMDGYDAVKLSLVASIAGLTSLRAFLDQHLSRTDEVAK